MKRETPEITLVKVGPDNLDGCGIGCLSNRNHEGYGPKVAWLHQRFEEGLRFLLFRDEKGKPLAFLEYVPGEYAWRPVDAKGWLFVHCLWVYSAGQKIGGLGSRLVQACIEEAKELGANGVAALVSDGPWMAGRGVFERNGFEVVAEEDRFQLVAHRLSKGPLPRFRDIGANLEKYGGLHVVYSAQCPMLPKSVNDLSEMAAENGLELNVTVLTSAAEAQNAPSYYGVFNLIWNGRLLSDHYVSKGRFKGLLRKEILPG
jgi:GNAT superfamily N-acetyltransferase